MKKIIGIIALLALLALPALAQQYSYTDLSVTNTLAASATTTANMGNTITLTKAGEVAVDIRAQGSSAGTGAITLTFMHSLDNSRWETATARTWVLAQNGTTEVVGVTNLDVGAIGYLKLKSIAVADDTDVTNVVVRYALKPVVQGND